MQRRGKTQEKGKRKSGALCKKFRRRVQVFGGMGSKSPQALISNSGEGTENMGDKSKTVLM